MRKSHDERMGSAEDQAPLLTSSHSPLLHLFNWVTKHPKSALAVWGIVFLGFALQIPRLTKESGTDAYIPPDHPAMQFWQETDRRFDLYEPVVVLIDTKRAHGIFNPDTLALVKWYTDQLATVDGIDPTAVLSLFSEQSVRGTEEGIAIAPFLGALPQSEAECAVVREKVMGFPLHLGTLVARDGSAAMISARLADRSKGGAVYHAILALSERAPIHGEEIFVAGQPVAGEYLSEYLDKDSTRMTIAAMVFIGPVLFLSYWTLRGLFLPGSSALCGAAVALGAMSILKAPYFVLTNVLPANVMALGVAYGIHILREYYEQTAVDPGPRRRETVVNVMMTMRRPIIYATLTDMVGFIALSLTSFMPPMQMMGKFAAIGIAATLVSTLIALPAALVLLPVKPSPALPPNASGGGGQRQDFWARILATLGSTVIAHPRIIVVACALLSAWGLYGATRVEVNDDYLSHFHASEPIHMATTAIDRAMDGTLFFDIIVETVRPEDLYKPENLRRIEELQRFLETLPHLGGTLSLVDYLKQMNKAMSDDDPNAFVLPDSEDLVAQYALLYSMGGTNALAHVVDHNYKTAVVRALCNSGQYSNTKVIRERTERYLETAFNAPGITARMSGRLNIHYEWMRRLEPSHILGALLALLTVWLMTTIGFRTWVAGLYCMVPVLATLVAVYAVMGVTGIWLGVGTSAFASIAIGITVNFSIHELDRLTHLIKEDGMSLEHALLKMYATTGRAVLFNFLCLIVGIASLAFSQLPPLQWFGILLSTALLVGFAASLVLLPAMLLVFRPRFLEPPKQNGSV